MGSSKGFTSVGVCFQCHIQCPFLVSCNQIQNLIYNVCIRQSSTFSPCDAEEFMKRYTPQSQGGISVISTGYTKIIKNYRSMLLSFPCGRHGVTLQGREHYPSASSSTWNSPLTQAEGKMRLPAGPLQIFIKPYTEQEMLPQNLTILCEVVLKILSKENRKGVHIYTHTCRKNALLLVFKELRRNGAIFFTARPTPRTYKTRTNVPRTGHDLDISTLKQC